MLFIAPIPLIYDNTFLLVSVYESIRILLARVAKIPAVALRNLRA
jgi:hypothetical protein